MTKTGFCPQQQLIGGLNFSAEGYSNDNGCLLFKSAEGLSSLDSFIVKAV
jgi:hypothetical protein